MSFKCVKMFCNLFIMYICLMNLVLIEYFVYLFSQVSMYFFIYCSYFKSGNYLVLNNILIIIDQIYRL